MKTLRSRFAPIRYSQFTKAVRRMAALLRGHQQPDRVGAKPTPTRQSTRMKPITVVRSNCDEPVGPSREGTRGLNSARRAGPVRSGKWLGQVIGTTSPSTRPRKQGFGRNVIRFNPMNLIKPVPTEIHAPPSRASTPRSLSPPWRAPARRPRAGRSGRTRARARQEPLRGGVHPVRNRPPLIPRVAAVSTMLAERATARMTESFLNRQRSGPWTK